MSIVHDLANNGFDSESYIELNRKWLILEAKEDGKPVSFGQGQYSNWSLALLDDYYTQIEVLDETNEFATWKEAADNTGLEYLQYNNNECGLFIPAGKGMMITLMNEDWNTKLTSKKKVDDVWVILKYGIFQITTKFKVLQEYIDASYR